jgi:diacylglycerol kinase family enzyme
MADVAAMNGKKFIMVAGAGFDARVTEEMGKVRRGKVSNLSYLLPMWRSMKTASPAPLQVETDGLRRATGAAVLVCNVRTYAGICEIAWQAGIDTGCLDVVVLPAEGLLPLATYLAAARFSRITRLKGVAYLKARQVRITSPEPIPIQVDGDFAGRHQEVRIDLAPSSLPLVVP